MAKILKTMLILLLCIVGAQDLFAKDKTKQNEISKYVYFEGNVNKKVPTGHGTLYIGGKWRINYNWQWCRSISITGNFEGDTITNGTLSLNGNVFYGTMEYSVINVTDKKAKSLKYGLTIKLISGNLKGYTISNGPSITVYYDIWDNTLKQFYLGMSPYIIEADSYGSSSKYIFKAHGGREASGEDANFSFDWLSTKTADGALDNGRTIKWPNGDYVYYTKSQNLVLDKINITLSDSSLITSVGEDNARNTKFHVCRSNSFVYDGTINFGENSPYSHIGGNHPYRASVKASSLIGSFKSVSSSDLKYNTGEVKYSDGNIDIYKDGVLISSSKEYQKNPYISKLPKYDDVIKDKILIKGDMESKFKALCKDNIYWFAGKNSLDELDKELYRQSDQYKTDSQHFNKLKQTDFYAVESIRDMSFKTSSFNFIISNYHSEGYKRMPHISSLYFPLKSGVVDFLYYITIKESDLNLLKTLKDAQKNLSILVVMRPDFEYGGAYVGKPSAIYLFDSATNTIVYDMSSYIGTASRSKFAAEDKREDDAWRARQKNIRHHSTPKRSMCSVCGGKGYVTGVNLDGVKGRTSSRCTNCYGKGYTETYDY